MAGAYLEIVPQETYTFTSNVLLNNAAVELYQSTLWFTAVQDQSDYFATNFAPFINLVSTGGSIAISNANTNVNSVITVTLNSAFTANLGYINTACWSLVAKTSTNAVYGLDHGRMAVIQRVNPGHY